jgi:hypothetical protein
MPGVRALTQQELNRALLARQQLLEPGGAALPRTLERIGGIQAQYAPSTYIGLWSRLRELRRDDVTRALERRTIVQGTLMRMTIHVVSRADYWPFALATRETRRAHWLRTRPGGAPEPERMEEAAAAVRSEVGDGTISRKQLEALVGKELALGVGLWVDLVRAPPSGTWERRRADLFAIAEHWIGGPGGLTPGDAIEHLVRRYLAGFGPASRQDVARYCGLTVTAVAPALERIATRRFVVDGDGDGGELVDLPRAPLPDPDTPAPPRLLPTWDATLLTHARRSGVLPEEHRPRIFHTKNPQSTPTYLIDGRVAGAWKWQDGLKLEPYERLDAGDRRSLENLGDEIASLFSESSGKARRSNSS